MPPRTLILGALLFGSALPAELRAQEAIREEVARPTFKLTKTPALLKFVPAVYPARAKEEGIEGTVELAIDLDAKGKVVAVKVLSSPDQGLSEAAEQAVWQFEFSAGEVNGRPAPVRLTYAYNFVLDIRWEPELPTWAEEQEAAAPGSDVLVGRVKEQGTRLPVAGAAVAIRSLGLEVKTDGQGSFGFRKVPPGKHEVEAISLEHKKTVVEAEVSKGQQTRITFYVEPLTDNPYETVVRGERRQTVVTRITLRQKELTTVPGTFGDPLRVVENLPGVNRVPYVGGALLIRGAAPQDSRVLLDGTEIPLLYHFLGGPSVLNPEFLDRIDYYPGNADVRYGRLLAGVVDVTTRDTFTEKWGGAIDLNLLNVALLLKVPLHEKVSVTAAFRRSYIDALLAAALEASGESATTVAPVYYDYQVRTDVHLSGDNRLYFLVFGSDDALDIVSSAGGQDFGISLDSNTVFHRLLAGWRWQISDRVVSKLTPTLGINYVNFELGELAVDFRTFNFLLREDLEIKLRKRITLRTGLDVAIDHMWADTKVPRPVDYRNPGSGHDQQYTQETMEYTMEATLAGVGLYADAIFQVTDRLQLIPGVRADLFYYYGNTELSVDPRLTARFKLFSKTTLKAGAGLFSQAPDIISSHDEYGNPNLNPEHAAHFSGGFEQKILGPLTLDVQGFYIRRWDQAIPTSQVVERNGEPRRLYYTNEGEGYAYGMELMLKHDVTRRFYGWIAYTLSRSEEKTRADLPMRLFFYDQTHILTLVASVRLCWGLEVGARFRLVSGRPETPVLGGIFDADQNRYRRLTAEIQSERMPLFHQLDLRVEKTWIFRLWKLSLYLDVMNVYNAENPEATLYDYRYRESGPLLGLPILPTLGLKGSF